MRINEIIDIAHETAIEHGWHEDQRTFGELIALCHSELSEALEDYRKQRTATEVYHEGNKPCGIPVELADVVIRIADMCGLYGIDLAGAIREKLDYNRTRPYRHGGKRI